MRILDDYSGPASCLWGTRSLVVAFMNPFDSRFWSAPEQPLPVEQGDFDITSAASTLRVIGTHETETVVVEHLHQNVPKPQLRPYTWKHKLAEWVFRRPFRPNNKQAKYGGKLYRSDRPFCDCAADSDGSIQSAVEHDKVSLDTHQRIRYSSAN